MGELAGLYQSMHLPTPLNGTPTREVSSSPPSEEVETAVTMAHQHKTHCKYCNQKGHFNFECQVPHQLCHLTKAGRCSVPTWHKCYAPYKEGICIYEGEHSRTTVRQKQRGGTM